MVVFNVVTVVWCAAVVISLGYAGYMIRRYNNY